MLHVLDFPYNGETLWKYILGDGKLTENRHHLYVSDLHAPVHIILTRKMTVSETTAVFQTSMTMLLSSRSAALSILL